MAQHSKIAPSWLGGRRQQAGRKGRWTMTRKPGLPTPKEKLAVADPRGLA